MNPIWIQLIISEGLPLAYEIWKVFAGNTEPTEADWQKLLAIAGKTEQQYVDEAAASAVILPPTPPEQTPGTPVPPAP
jgi:hypothetical protein